MNQGSGQSSASAPRADARIARVVSAVLGCAVVAHVALSAAALTRFDAAVLFDNYVIVDAIIGVSFGACGWIITRYRPRNAVGWLLLAAGLGYATTAGLASALALDLVAEPLRAPVLTVTLAAWPAAITGLLPAALVLFPDGRPISAGWWVVLASCAAWAVCATLVFSTMTTPGFALAPGLVGYSPLRDPALYAAVDAAQIPLGVVAYGGAVAALVHRYRRGDDVLRRQLLWVVLAAIVVFGSFAFAPGAPVVPALALITAIPLAILIAIVRHRLLDIRLAVSRTLLYLSLAAIIIVVYTAIVVGTDQLLRTESNPTGALVAAIVVAVGFSPARSALHRLIDRLFYGSRDDPAETIRELGRHLDSASGIGVSLEAVCRSLRLPWATIVAEGATVAGWGDSAASGSSAAIELSDGAELHVGLRSGERSLDGRDEATLRLLGVPLGAAVTAARLATQLERSREEILVARREERERLRRDLHDGLGPSITAIVLKADAARRLLRTDAARSVELMGDVRLEATGLSMVVRQLIDALRPESLEHLGLVAAVEREARRLSTRADGERLDITIDMSAADAVDDIRSETAIFRIVAEALTNVSRHSHATSVEVTLSAQPGSVVLEVRDDGQGSDEPWTPGVGLTSMRERAAEVGGELEVRSSTTGTVVRASVPVGREQP
jgi:two-component system NarL family sensor kinase